MGSQQAGQTSTPVKKRVTRNAIIFAAGLLILTFLAGFLPGYMKGQRLEKELVAAREENSRAQLRDLACLAFLQASQKDYGLAAGTSTRLFNRTRKSGSQTLDAAARISLEDLVRLRDPINAKLATGDPAVLNELQDLLVKTRQATAGSSGGQER